MIAVVPVDGGVQQRFPQGFVWVVPAVDAMESAESRAQLVVLFQIGVCLLQLGEQGAAEFCPVLKDVLVGAGESGRLDGEGTLVGKELGKVCVEAVCCHQLEAPLLGLLQWNAPPLEFLLGGHKGEALVQTPGTLEPLPVAFFYHPHGCLPLSSYLILSSLSMIR